MIEGLAGGRSIRDNHVDDHHLFPLDFLGEKNRRAPNPKLDNILNRTLIDAETNRRIGANAPSKYLSDIEKAQGPELLDPTLESHGIDAAARAALRADDFEAFLSARQTAFVARVQLATAAPALVPEAAE